MSNSPITNRSTTKRRIGAVGAITALCVCGIAAASPRVSITDGGAARGANTAADTSAAPAVGSEAPDFTAPLVGADGKATTVTLRALRKRVVVVAFYPKDRSGGCTAELSKFRDEFASLFGEGVTVLPVSVDDMSSHAGWAADMHFPFALVSDTSGAIARSYGSIEAGRPYTNRTVFVIGKDGRVVWRELRFGALDQHAYDALAAAVAAAKRD